MCKHYKIKVTGKVQGVWFRKYTLLKALDLGLKGIVKNESDGSVYIEVESDNEEFLQSFIQWLYEGSPQSKPKEVIILEEKNACLGYKNFSIKK